MEQRLELVLLASQENANISELCYRYGISRKVCYKWLTRYKSHGEEGLVSLSKRPKSSPNQTARIMEQKIIRLRQQNPEWGARKLRALLERESPQGIPSASTIGAILLRNGLIKPERSLQQTPVQRFEYEHPNELWQMDFKSGFSLLNKICCYPLTITDDNSRFNLCLAACTNQQSLTVKEQLIRVFRKYGMPDRILTDNGSPWGTAGNHTAEGESTLSALEVWLLQLSIKVIHGRAYHPQTQGKEERFHRTLKTELLQYEQFRDITHCQNRFDKWRARYNMERPHQALSFKTPAQIYSHSIRRFPERLPKIEYPSEDMVRKVNDKGYINFKGYLFKIGKGLINQSVAVRKTNVEDLYEIYFCNKKIKDIFWQK